MTNPKIFAGALVLAAVGVITPVAAHDHADAADKTNNDAQHASPASDAGGTPGEQGVGGSVEVPGADNKAEATTPYEEVGEDVGEPSDDREIDDVTADQNAE